MCQRPVVLKTAAAESGTAAQAPGTDFTKAASCSSSQGSCGQKAKALDVHLPSLKRRKLDSGTLGHRLSTLALQNDKRMEDELRGGKRKIKLGVQSDRSEDVSEEDKAARAKLFLADMKKSLSKVNFDRIVQALQTYKKTDELDVLLTETAVLSEDANTHSLLRGFYQFVRPHHKRRFDERCEQLTGQGCGYKPEHSLSKDQKKAVMLRGGTSSSAYSQLDTQQLNRGGQHLSQGDLQGLERSSRLKRLSCGSSAQNQARSTFAADVKKALGAERCARLSDAISNYKKTDNYEDLVTTVVSLFTERDDNFQLLTRFSLFIHPHHKKKYKELLDALMGQQATSTSGEVIFLTDFLSIQRLQEVWNMLNAKYRQKCSI
uniref:Uncharacterized protein n=1 Tax=Oryzias latipes TaxID=8090 RepID=A0A3P9I3Q4_ORYLA